MFVTSDKEHEGMLFQIFLNCRASGCPADMRVYRKYVNRVTATEGIQDSLRACELDSWGERKDKPPDYSGVYITAVIT